MWQNFQMRHVLPPVIPAFRDAVSTDPIQEIALRVVVELPNWEFHTIGTAVFIAGNLAVTARHVLEAVTQNFGVGKTRGSQIEEYSLTLYQVIPEPLQYRVWSVTEAWGCSTDIALLHVQLDRTSTEESNEWKVPRLRLFPPPSGQVVFAFGYREGRIEVNEGADGTHHINVSDRGTTSVGTVGEIFHELRDASMLSFPCFEVNARFAPGMSGGLVLDEAGSLCGLVCAGMQFDDPLQCPLSYAATLWPMLTTLISIDRGARYPRGIEYPVIDLLLAGFIHATGVEDLDPTKFPGRSLLARRK
jgi:hypothetical protein